MITANTGEVAQGTLAQSKATNASVRSFGRMMVNDHGAALSRLEALATRRGITPEANPVSETLKSESDAIVAQLQALTGDAFDMAYIAAQVTVHTKVLGLLDDVLIPEADDSELKSELNAARASVAAHLEQAQQIQSSLHGDAGDDAGYDGG